MEPPVFAPEELELLRGRGFALFAGRPIAKACPPITQTQLTRVRRLLGADPPQDVLDLWAVTFGGVLGYLTPPELAPITGWNPPNRDLDHGWDMDVVFEEEAEERWLATIYNFEGSYSDPGLRHLLVLQRQFERDFGEAIYRRANRGIVENACLLKADLACGIVEGRILLPVIGSGCNNARVYVDCGPGGDRGCVYLWYNNTVAQWSGDRHFQADPVLDRCVRIADSLPDLFAIFQPAPLSSFEDMLVALKPSSQSEEPRTAAVAEKILVAYHLGQANEGRVQ